MIPYGDIPEKDRQIIKEILILESWLEKYKSGLPTLSIAKSMVCLAHDWYVVHMEEEGDRFLNKAEELCPGYFTAPISIQMKNDPEFRLLVRQMKDTLGWDFMIYLGLDSEQV